jgi:hypothetical protein
VNGELYIQLWSVKKLFRKEYNKSMRNVVKEFKITPKLEKITGIQEKLDTTCK